MTSFNKEHLRDQESKKAELQLLHTNMQIHRHMTDVAIALNQAIINLGSIVSRQSIRPVHCETAIKSIQFLLQLIHVSCRFLGNLPPFPEHSPIGRYRLLVLLYKIADEADSLLTQIKQFRFKCRDISDEAVAQKQSIFLSINSFIKTCEDINAYVVSFTKDDFNSIEKH